MFRFHNTYFLLSLFLFWFAVLLSLFIHDPFIRIYAGDFLVVMLLYCFTRSFMNLSSHLTLLIVLAFVFALEIAQYFSVVNRLGLDGHPLAMTLIGNVFAWQDLLAYTMGAVLVFLMEQFRMRKVVAVRD